MCAGRTRGGVRRPASCGAVLLAAGASTRMGTTKALMDWGGEAWVVVGVRKLLAAGAQPVVAVLGCESERAAAALRGLDVETVVNDDWRGDMFESVRMGFRAVPSPEAVAVALVDQPHLGVEDIRAVLAAAGPDRIVLPVCKGRRGHPVVVGRSFREEIVGAAPGTTLRDIVARHASRVVMVETDSEAVVLDLDTPEAVAAARARYLGAEGGEQPR